MSGTHERPTTIQQPLRVLHFGFEDPMMPGAGGGSVRTHEINRRLAAQGHLITVLTTRYPGWKERLQDGVHYVPIGFGSGKTRLTRLIGYCCRLPLETWRRGAQTDLAVEDFFAPFSTMAAPLWTGRPTIGIVQWLHAREKFRQYKIPFHWIERAGVRRHRRLIAVSEGTAEQVRDLHPGAIVDVIGNGLDRPNVGVSTQRRNDIVCLGRLEFVGKGIDLLLEAWALAAPKVGGTLVIAGAGPDEKRIRETVAAAHLDRVRLAGWVSGQQKFELLSGARLVVVPSRKETFGIVALEALASGTPVIAFDIPCLREVLPPGCGWVVPAFDSAALAEEIAQRYYDQKSLAAARENGPAFAAGFNWDVLAARQLDAYISALPDLAGTSRRLGRKR